jgi:hypothetical protein
MNEWDEFLAFIDGADIPEFPISTQGPSLHKEGPRPFQNFQEALSFTETPAGHVIDLYRERDKSWVSRKGGKRKYWKHCFFPSLGGKGWKPCPPR